MIMHRFRPVSSEIWSDWREGNANLTPASNLEWETFEFQPIRLIESYFVTNATKTELLHAQTVPQMLRQAGVEVDD